MDAYVLLPLAVNRKTEQKVHSLPPIGLEPTTFDLSDYSAYSPTPIKSQVGAVKNID
jgi:hypothetical protein